MARPMTNPPVLQIPLEPDADRLPRYLSAPQIAALHVQWYGPISPRTLREVWPLTWLVMNGRLVTETRAFLAEAQRRFDAAPRVRGGPLAENVAA
jgi:hypothetical protein